MASLTSCIQCGGFVPAGSGRCPNCHAQRSRGALRKLLNVAGGGAVALTLMACYGGPPQGYLHKPATPDRDHSCRNAGDDIDGDGFCADDCDEVNAQVYPGAADQPGDGIDQNCDGADGVRTAELAR